MIITYKQLHLVNWPVFGLPSDNLMVQDGLLFLDNLVVDDRNQIGDTLGKRRVQTPHKLHHIKYCYEDIVSMLRGRHRVFVDNHGYCFRYEKTKYCTVQFYKIKEVIKKGEFSFIKIPRVTSPIPILRPPPPQCEWVGMLLVDDVPWLPYQYSEHKCPAFRRKI